MISMVLPFPPSANTYYRHSQHGMYLSKQGRAYKTAVAEHVASLGLSDALQGRLNVFVSLSSPTKRAYDVDNRIKPLFDALQDAGVFDDDGQIDSFTVSRQEPRKGGSCHVAIMEIA